MADICVPPDCLNGYDCYWLFFCLFTGINTKKLNTFSILDTIYCDILWYILLYSYYCYISLCICIISGIGSPIYGNPFYYLGKWLKLVIAVVYTVIYSYLVIYTVIYLLYIYSILLQKLCLLPPVNSVTSSCNSVASE